MRRLCVTLLLAIMSAGVGAGAARAQDAIRIVVPFAPGGITDPCSVKRSTNPSMSPALRRAA